MCNKVIKLAHDHKWWQQPLTNADIWKLANQTLPRLMSTHRYHSHTLKHTHTEAGEQESTSAGETNHKAWQRLIGSDLISN